MHAPSPASPLSQLRPFPAFGSLTTNSTTQEPDLQPHPEHTCPSRPLSVLYQDTVQVSPLSSSNFPFSMGVGWVWVLQDSHRPPSSRCHSHERFCVCLSRTL